MKLIGKTRCDLVKNVCVIAKAREQDNHVACPAPVKVIHLDAISLGQAMVAGAVLRRA